MKNLKGYIAIILLTLFAVTIIPKEVYHDCGHDHITKSDLQKDEINNGDCPICDYTFSSPIQVKRESKIDTTQLISGYSPLTQQVIAIPPTEIPTLRGPPVA